MKSTVLLVLCQMLNSSLCMISRVCASREAKGSSMSNRSGINQESPGQVHPLLVSPRPGTPPARSAEPENPSSHPPTSGSTSGSICSCLSCTSCHGGGEKLRDVVSDEALLVSSLLELASDLLSLPAPRRVPKPTSTPQSETATLTSPHRDDLSSLARQVSSESTTAPPPHNRDPSP